MPHSDHPRVFFLHLPKCAGMTLHAVIERQYEPEEIYTVPSVSWNDRNYQALCDEWNQERKARLRIVKGHMAYGWHKAFGGEPYEYITLLRHPIERVLSLYSFINDWHTDYLFKQEGLGVFIRRAVEAHNDMTFWLSGGIGRGARAFIKAWHVLTQEICLVGTVETFDQTVDALAKRYGWEVTNYERQNVTPERRRDLSPRDARALLQRNQYDLMLYAYAMRHSNDGL